MLNINGTKISLTKGDTAYLNIGVLDSNGSPYYPHEGDKITLTVKKFMTDTEPALQKTANFGEVMQILPEDTSSMKSGKYWYDVQLNTSLNEVFTVIDKSDFCLKEDVTD